MRTRLLAILVSGVIGTAGVAAADPAPKAAEPAADAAKPATCKRTVVGKGLERHVVCVFDPIVVHVDPPKPEVAIVHANPRGVVGRPRSGDRLAGLSHELR